MDGDASVDGDASTNWDASSFSLHHKWLKVRGSSSKIGDSKVGDSKVGDSPAIYIFNLRFFKS